MHRFKCLCINAFAHSLILYTPNGLNWILWAPFHGYLLYHSFESFFPMAIRKSGKNQLKSIDLELVSPVAGTCTWIYCALWQLMDGDDSVFLCSTTILISAAGRASSCKARLLHWDLQLPLPQLINQRQRPVIDLAEITAVNCCNFKCYLILKGYVKLWV